MSAVAIIPARGGSRRIKMKNVRLFHGKPIIAYSIEAAKASGLFDRIVVSSDDADIRIIARQCGAEAIEREMKYAQDDVGTQEVTRDALVELDLLGVRPDYACCVYATVPMLREDDLVNGFNVMRVTNDYAYVPGWFYWGRAEWFDVKPLREPAPLAIEPERYIDINSEQDWKRAEEMYAALHSTTEGR
jgi:pseudaminic acid cytidylyltransferase